MSAPQRLGGAEEAAGPRAAVPGASEDVDLPALLLHLRSWTGHLPHHLPSAAPGGPQPRPPTYLELLESFLGLLWLPVFHEPKPHGQQRS